MLVKPVHFEDDTVDFVGETVPFVHQLAVGFEAFLRAPGLAHLGINTETPALDSLEPLPLGIRQEAFVGYRNAVGAHFERASGGYRRLFLPEAAGRRITGINEGLLATLRQAAIKLLETVLRHVDFAADLHQIGHVVATELQRHRGNGSDIGGYVLPGIAIPPGGGGSQGAILVVQAHRQPVQLRFTDILHVLRDTEPIFYPPVKVTKFVLAERIIQRQHGQPVHYLLKAGFRGAANPPRGRRVRSQLWIIGFQAL